MRLEGAQRRDCERSSEKQLRVQAYHGNGVRKNKMYGTLHLPARLVPRHG
jgi:hypothetical protein